MAWGNFSEIHLDVPKDFINEALKADKDGKLASIVRREIKKAEKVQNQINHLISVLEIIRLRVEL